MEDEIRSTSSERCCLVTWVFPAAVVIKFRYNFVVVIQLDGSGNGEKENAVNK